MTKAEIVNEIAKVVLFFHFTKKNYKKHDDFFRHIY